MWLQKLSIPPPRKGFSLDVPTSLEIPVKLHTFTYIFGPLRPPTPQEFPIPSGGGGVEYGHLLELHNMTKFSTFLNYSGGARYMQLVGGELTSYRALLVLFSFLFFK